MYILLATVLIQSAVLTCAQQQLTIIATEHFPNGSTVSPAHLSCSVEPRDAVSHYRWLYNGEVIVNDTTPANGELVMVPFLNHTGSVIESFSDINNRTNLFITKLSYEDAGKYTCGFTSNEGQNFSATIHVQLTLTVEHLGNFIRAYYPENSTVELMCGMSGFIRPDKDFLWSRGDDIIMNGTGRYTVEYRYGQNHNSAQNGDSDAPVPNRVSVLTISDPVPMDTGVYVCGVTGTNTSANVDLLVIGEPISNETGPGENTTINNSTVVSDGTGPDPGVNDTTNNSTVTGEPLETIVVTTTRSQSEDIVELPVLVGIVALGGVLAALSVLIIILVMCGIMVRRKRQRKAAAAAAESKQEVEEIPDYASVAIVQQFEMMASKKPPEPPLRKPGLKMEENVAYGKMKQSSTVDSDGYLDLLPS